MTANLTRIFVERVTRIEPDTHNGNVKLTYAVRSGNSNEEVVQLIMHVNDLRRSFGEIWEVLQKSFTETAQTGPGSKLTDLTSE